MNAATNETHGGDDWAIFALGEIGQEPRTVVPVLIHVLESTKVSLQNRGLLMNAAWALGKFGPQAASATPALSKILTEQLANPVERLPHNGATTLGDAVTYALGAITNEPGNVVPAR
jgi:HEAT repeat protein